MRTRALALVGLVMGAMVVGQALGQAEGMAVRPMSAAEQALIALGARFSPDYSGNGAYAVRFDAGWKGTAADLAGLAALDATRAVTIVGDRAADEVLPHLGKMPGVKGLRLEGVSLSEGQVAAVMGLKVEGVMIGGALPEEVVMRGSKEIRRLEFEDVPGARLTIENMVALEAVRIGARREHYGQMVAVTLGGLPALRTLEIRGVAPGAMPLAAFSKLEEVNFYDAPVPVETVRQLGALKGLKRVGLGVGVDMGAAMESLAESHLTSIGVSAEVEDAEFMRIKDLSGLEVVAVGGPKISGRSLVRLAASTRLVSLWADGAQVDLATMEVLGKLRELVSLSLNNAPVGDDGVGRLVGLEKLYRLELRGTKMTDGGLVALAGSSALRELDVRGTRVTAEGVRRLRGVAPRLRVTFDEGAEEAK